MCLYAFSKTSTPCRTADFPPLEVDPPLDDPPLGRRPNPLVASKTHAWRGGRASLAPRNARARRGISFLLPVPVPVREELLPDVLSWLETFPIDPGQAASHEGSGGHARGGPGRTGAENSAKAAKRSY